MRNTDRGIEIPPTTALPFARLTDDDRRLIRMLIIALAAFTATTIIGIVLVTADLIMRDAEREETVATLLVGEERRRTNFELLGGYMLCLIEESHRRGGDPAGCPKPSFVPPPTKVKLVPSEMPSVRKAGERRPSADGPP